MVIYCESFVETTLIRSWNVGWESFCSIFICLLWLIVFVGCGRNGKQVVKVVEVCFETASVPLPQELPLGNENCCNKVGSTKMQIFSVPKDVFPFSQHFIKSYSKKNLTEEELLFHYRHPRKRRLIENVFGIRIDRFRIFGIRATLTPAWLVAIVTLELHNFLRLKP